MKTDPRHGAKMKDISPDLQPREILMKVSTAEELHQVRDEVLLANILRTGVKGTNVLEAAQKLRTSCDSLTELMNYPSVTSFIKYLKARNIHGIGIGKDKAAALIAAFELGRRAAEARQKSSNDHVIRYKEDVFRILKPLADDLTQEKFWVLMLNQGRKLMRPPLVVSKGTANGTIVEPRDVFQPALQEGAKSIIVGHNHISENLDPSSEDQALTKILSETGRIVGIKLLGHLIVSSLPSCQAHTWLSE